MPSVLTRVTRNLLRRWDELRDGSHAPLTVAQPPSDMLTDDDGPYRRLRVDAGQTGFFAGREFRVFAEFSLAAAASIVWKFDLTLVEAILQHLELNAWDGSVRFELIASDATESAPFNTPVPARRTNRMSTADLAYTGQVAVSTGGAYTGGTLTEAAELETSQGSGHHHESANDFRPYGLPVGVYFIKATNTGAGTARGSINVRWEERP